VPECRTCGTVITEISAAKHGGLCAPCRRGSVRCVRCGVPQPPRSSNLCAACQAASPAEVPSAGPLLTSGEFEEISRLDREPACHLIFDRIHDRWTAHGKRSLSEKQIALFAVETFFGEVCNGGFYQYLTNESGGLANHLVASLKVVGLPAYAEIARGALSLFPNGLSNDSDVRFDEIDSLAEDMVADHFDSLDEQFFARYDSERPATGDHPFRVALHEYILRNRPAFAPEGTAEPSGCSGPHPSPRAGCRR
jgi:hypothetical protein